MVRVFEWGYQGGHPIQDYMLSRPGYTDIDFEKDFSEEQRRNLTSSTPADVENFDITLLYKLLQLECGLAESTNPQWKGGSSLEYLLFCLKDLRNNVVHEEPCLTQQSLDTKLLELQQLLIKIYQSAGVRFGKDYQLVTQLTTEVKDKIAGIKAKIRENLQPADVAELEQLQQEIQIFGDQFKLKVKQMGFPELAEGYKSVYMLEPAPWLRLNVNLKPSLAFTELQIEEDETISGQPSLTNQARKVKCEEILQVTLKNGNTPDVIIMIGEEGTGKTTLYKYMMEKWIFDAKAVHGLDQVDILLYTQCQKSGILSFDQLLKYLLTNTLQSSFVNLDFFRETVLKLKTIILVDGYDKADKDAEILLKNILQVAGDFLVIVTTRPQSKDQLIHLIPSQKCRLDLIVKGIAPELHSQYIDTLIDVLVDTVDERANIKESLGAKLQDLEITFGHQLSPLILTLVVLLWVECPRTFNASTPVTEVCEELKDMLTESW